MPIDTSDLASFEIKYETESSVPAPFAHFYHLKAQVAANNELRIDYQLHYLDRESLSEEEITGEGFTMNDDIAWRGNLSSVWTGEMKKLLSTTSLRKGNESDNEAFLELVIEGKKGKKQEGEPQNRLEWEYAAQELIQAIYETAQRESPLQLQYKKVNADGSFLKLSLTLRFSTRQIDVRQETSSGQSQRQVAWDQMKDLLRTVYMPDYHPGNAQSKEPRKPGMFIDSGDGLWYEFSVSVKNPGNQRDVLSEIARIFEGLKD